VNPISSRMKFRLVVAGYAAVVTVAAALLFVHHLVELQDPAAASGGMAATGEMMLVLFIGFLFLIPTAFLVWFMADSEARYTTYSQILLGLSLTSPVCMIVVIFGQNRVAPGLSWFCFYRVMESPIFLAGIGMSRFFARFDRAKRFTTYALLVEGLTLVLAVAGLIASMFTQR
jgi:hypothetical protein